MAPLTVSPITLSLSNSGTDLEGNFVLRFSQKFLDLIASNKRKGYVPTAATVHFLVYWPYAEEKEAVIVLPRVGFEKE